MEDQTRERWYQLCGQAALEQDSKKLLALVTELNSVLEMRDSVSAALGRPLHEDPQHLATTNLERSPPASLG